MTENAKIWTVSGLNRRLRILLDQQLPFLWVSGELSNLTIHQSGHVYFSLKDDRGQIRGAFFDGAAIAQRMDLKNGMEIEVYGKVRIYEANGSYQVCAEQIRPGGMGRLQREFLELKQKLEAEGLFDPSRKKPIPELPACIGLITSVNGAAIRDFLQVVERRFPETHIRVVNSKMQGADSAMQATRAIRYLNRNQSCDVIVLTRGGGSMEDLWCFNDETLVRTVADSETPIISAIGHEIDFTLCDFAADLRVPTPSAAAELVIGRKSEYRMQLKNLSARLNAAVGMFHSRRQVRFQRAIGRLETAVTHRLTSAKQRLLYCRQHYLMRQPQLMLQPHKQRLMELQEDLQRNTTALLDDQRSRLKGLVQRLSLVSPQIQVESQKQRLAALQQRLVVGMDHNVDRLKDRLEAGKAQLRMLDPKQVLSRGYSILLDEGRKAIRSKDDVTPGDELRAMVCDGELHLTVEG